MKEKDGRERRREPVIKAGAENYCYERPDFAVWALLYMTAEVKNGLKNIRDSTMLACSIVGGIERIEWTQKSVFSSFSMPSDLI